MDVFEKYLESLKKIPNLDINKMIESGKDSKIVGIRFNLKKLCENGVVDKNEQNITEKLTNILNANGVLGNIKQIPWCKQGYIYYGQKKPGKNILHELGAYYIQEPSAMAPVEFLDVKEDSKVLDLCASPGGKSTQIAEKLNGGFLIANEIVPSRAKTLAENIERLGFNNTIVLNHSPKDIENRFIEFFDRILVDAPCSGEGMFRKNDEAIFEWNENVPKQCAVRQKEIIESAYKMLAPNGKLVYSTCTFSLEENEEVIKHILDNHPDMQILPIEHEKYNFEKGIDIDNSKQLINCARLYPYKINGEGHFFAVLQKTKTNNFDYDANKQSNFCAKNINNLNKKRDYLQKNSKNINIFNDFAKKYNLLTFNNYVSFNETLFANCPINLDSLKTVYAGVKLGEINKNIFTPSYSLSHCLNNKSFNNTVEVSTEDAKRYIKGLEIEAKNNNGWALLTYNNIPLAFGKCVAGKIKNHYPKALRKQL